MLRRTARVPRSGPVLFVANHPFGVVDGLLMGDLATRIRPDTKMMTHSLLCQVPEAREFLLPVDFGGTPEAVQTSAMTRRRCVEWLRGGHAVAVFPAGSVSTSVTPLVGPAVDAAWHPFAAKLALLPGVRKLTCARSQIPSKGLDLSLSDTQLPGGNEVCQLFSHG
jgi:putative hemolysin